MLGNSDRPKPPIDHRNKNGSSFKKSQLIKVKVFGVWQHGSHVGLAHTKPQGQLGGHLVCGCRRQEATAAHLPVVGDADLIAQILEVRKHAGMMVPLPVQKAMIAALSDSDHVAEQRRRYNSRKDLLIPALKAAGFSIDFSDAGLYLWATRDEDCWQSVAWLASLGILATPGIFYGDATHIRVAMTATDAQISEAAARITAAVGA